MGLHVEDAAYGRSKKDEDNKSEREQQQEPEDHWMIGSGLMVVPVKFAIGWREQNRLRRV